MNLQAPLQSPDRATDGPTPCGPARRRKGPLLATGGAVLAIALALGLAWAAAPPGSIKALPTQATAAPLVAKNLLLAGTQIPRAGGTRLVAVGEHGHVLLSDDAGATWRQAKTVPTITTLTAVQFINDRQGWAVGHGGVVIGTQDGGDTWALLAGALDGKEVLLSLHFADALNGLVVGAFGYAARTGDGGKTWAPLTLAEGEDGERHLNQLFISRPAAAGAAGAASDTATLPASGLNAASAPAPAPTKPAQTLWVAAESGLLFRSDDSGARWQVVKLPYKGSIWGGTQLADGALLVWGMGGHVLRSDDGGKTFAELPTGTEQSLGGAWQVSADQVVVAGLGGAVVLSQDGGRHFATTVRDDRASLAAVLPGAAGQVLLLGQAGVLPQAQAAGASAPSAAATLPAAQPIGAAAASSVAPGAAVSASAPR